MKPDLHVAFNNMTMLLRAQIKDKFKTKQKPIVMMVMQATTPPMRYQAAMTRSEPVEVRSLYNINNWSTIFSTNQKTQMAHS